MTINCRLITLPHDPWNPRLSISSQADRLGLDHSDQSTAIVVNVPATFTDRTASSRSGPDPSPRSARARQSAAGGRRAGR